MTSATPEDDAAHVLVVDDDRRLRALLSTYLMKNGHRVTVAATAAEARDLSRWPGFRHHRARRDDAGRERLRIRCGPAKAVPGADPDADRAGRAARPRAADSKSASTIICPSRSNRASFCCGSAPSFAARGPAPFGKPRRLSCALARSRFRSNAANCAPAMRSSASPNASARCCGFFAPVRATSVSREALSGSGGAAQERTVDVLINRLRRKIEQDPANPAYLQTARGTGYRLIADG